MSRIQAFDPSFFDQTVYLQAATYAAGARFGVAPADASPGVPVAAYVEQDTDRGRREERQHGSPEGVRRYNVFTAADPGLAVDDGISWNGRTLRVVCVEDVDGQGVLWRTECESIASR